METPQVAGMLRYSLQQGQRPFIAITSDSMAPLLRRGDQVQIEAAAWQTLQAGDLVLVQAPVDLLTHRYWGSVPQAYTDCLLLRGDRPLEFDGLLPASSLIGRVICRRRQQRVLDLQRGAGGWLNRHLARLSRAEIRLFGAANALPAAERAYLPLSPFPGAAWLRRRPWAMRAIRRALYAWASLLARLVA